MLKLISYPTTQVVCVIKTDQFRLCREITFAYSDIRNINAQRVQNVTVAGGAVTTAFCANATRSFGTANIPLVSSV